MRAPIPFAGCDADVVVARDKRKLSRFQNHTSADVRLVFYFIIDRT